MQEIKKLDALKPEALLEFLREKAKNFKCDVCGKSEWRIFAQEGHSVILPIQNEQQLLEKASITFERFMLMIPYSCTNCGNIRAIDRKVIQQWAEKKESDDER